MGRIGSRGNSERGLTLIEVMVAATIALGTALLTYEFVDATQYAYTHETDKANRHSAGRAVLDLFSDEVRVAGASPLGIAFDAVPVVNANTIALVADIDGDGSIGTAGELGENITYRFTARGDGDVFVLERGVDLNWDGDFDDDDESVETLTEDAVRIDHDRNGTPDAFIAFDVAAPDTHIVTLTIGVRAPRMDHHRGEFRVTSFQRVVTLRNRPEGGIPWLED